MVTDPISDMLIRIKNAGSSKKTFVSIPYSGFKFEIARELEKGGFIKSIDKKGKKVKKTLVLELLYDDLGKHKINDVSRISKPSKRIYCGSKELTTYAWKRGGVFISTQKGIVTAKQAINKKIGGEVLFRIW
jgi:small subunit ribosomal protein S8